MQQDNTIKEEVSLNERIYDALNDNDCYVHDSDGSIDFEETHKAANAIEKLILQEKIDLLESIKWKETPTMALRIKQRISVFNNYVKRQQTELENQLKELQ